MIDSIEFKNFKALRDTTLPLGPCTIIVGPNGSGKSTVLQALETVRQCARRLLRLPTKFDNVKGVISFSARGIDVSKVSIRLNSHGFLPATGFLATGNVEWGGNSIPVSLEEVQTPMAKRLSRIRVFSLDPGKIAGVAPVQGTIELAPDGAGLAAVLDGIRDEAPEQFKAIESLIGEWLPEFDQILFDRPQQGYKSIALRTREGQHKVPASDLSQGTLVALALLTLAYHPTPPSLVALEEPDRGIHPFLLRHVRDALYRMSHPESCGETREPVQVIATTHSPYFLDLFKDSPEEIVVANKVGLDVKFERLTDQPHFHDILGDAALSDAWFSGVLGGVPTGS